MTSVPPIPRYSGHETFVCRYAWLPKVVKELTNDPALFKSEDSAMVCLGIGKNMVRSVKFWAESAQIIEDSSKGCIVTPFGQQLLGHDGHDQYLERSETLWLLHWKISSNPVRPLFHWQQMLNFWHRSEFCESEAIPFLERELSKDPKGQKSQRTLSDGFKVFVNSYVPTKGKKGEVAEDNLDCPLAELGLLRIAGERINKDNNRELIYSFNVEPKASISPALFAYCLDDFWRNSIHRGNESLGFRIVASGEGSPGQIFKLPESAVRMLLDNLSSATSGAIAFEESQSMQQAWRKRPVSEEALLEAIFPF